MRPKWRRFEEEIATFLSSLRYHGVELQVTLPAVRTRKEAQRRFPEQPYVAAPRFDIVARRPLTFARRYVECKRYAAPVGVAQVEAFADRLWLCGRPWKQGLVVALPRLTDDAARLAERYGLAVWGGRSLERKLILAAALSPSPLGGARAACRAARYIAGTFT